METRETNGNGKSVAIEIVKPRQIVSAAAYEPHSFDEAMRMAETLAKSKMFGVASPEAAFVIMSTGADLGLSPTAALRSIFTVNNRPGLSADLMVALCLQSPECEYFRCVESTAEKATYAAKRKGNHPERRHSWTIEQARRANLANKDVWKAYPEDMLRHRAAAPLARELFPHLMLGLYCREELEEIAANEGREPDPVPQQVLEADVVTPRSEHDPLTAVTMLFLDAKTDEDLTTARAAAAKLNLEKGSDDYKALRALDKEAAERIG